MAEIQAAPAARSGKPRVKKLNFRLDMTPMVDLAFLLLTFFMLTATFNKATVMQLSMPAKGPATTIDDSQALTLILDKHRVHYYFGLNPLANDAPAGASVQTTTLAANGLRQVLLRFQQNAGHGMVLIKTSKDATYQDMVDALDEMNITGQQKYALTDLDQHDQQWLAMR
ncbi:biopolymer transporter ExbD [Hymenobacter lutimineralis]|uniref:Biopolymer transporter ExbD n=1 Tax=Hymenobacter lutimineralis TaxID=2606448 RepID=A0A5D6VBW3_9BACT|nr:biopolymer transporter ExbD [Hymenobacter lutimineralis]TYZ13481.1 biopolymer transporter ExbD [Hymenobacter lutimineralis]